MRVLTFLKSTIGKKRSVTNASDRNTTANVYSKTVTVTLVISNRITLISYPASILDQYNGKLLQIENILVNAEF